MRLIDEKGRVFGRINIIDLAVILAILFLFVPMVIMAIKLKSKPMVSPASQSSIREQERTKLTGEYKAMLDEIESGRKKLEEDRVKFAEEAKKREQELTKWKNDSIDRMSMWEEAYKKGYERGCSDRDEK